MHPESISLLCQKELHCAEHKVLFDTRFVWTALISEAIFFCECDAGGILQVIHGFARTRT